MKPKFFKDQWQFRKWLEKNHKTEPELIVGFYKVDSGKLSMTWPESVDQALCFGWIDGVRRSIDEQSYQIRFTPRRSSSIWSKVNIEKVKKLTAEGLMFPAGVEAFKKRKEEKSAVYSFENEKKEFSSDFEKLFKSNKSAWEYFQSIAPSYRKVSTDWVMSAKQESARLKRLKELIADSEAKANKWKDNKYSKKK